MSPSDEEKNIASDDLESGTDSDSLESEGVSEDDIDSIFGASEDNSVAEATIISEDTSSSEIDEPEEAGYDEGTPEEGETDEEEEDEDLEGTVKKGLLKKIGEGFRNQWKMVCGFLLGSAALTSLALFGIIPIGDENKIEYNSVLQIYLASIESDTADVFFFDRFLVLLGDETEKAYLFLNLSIIPSNGGVYKEVKKKRTLCRNTIYSVLENMVKESKKIAGEEIREKIIEALNAILVTGHIEHVAFGEFIIV